MNFSQFWDAKYEGIKLELCGPHRITMQPSHLYNQKMPHTGRFQPSKQLMDINKRKMDEAKLLLSQLEKKLQTASSGQMKEAIVQ